MSVDGVTDERPRLSNGSNPAEAGRASETADSENRPDVPTVEERLYGLFCEYPEKMFTPTSTKPGQKLRKDCMTEPETVVRRVEVGDHEERVERTVVEREGVELRYAVENLLRSYEGYRDKALLMTERSVGGDDFLVDLDMSYSPEYQSRNYAQLKALRRLLIDGEYTTGRECEASFEEPVVVLFGLTSSGTLADGSPRPIVDHARSIRDAWSGSTSSTKRVLRDVLERRLGLDSSSYAWWFQAEPHPGDGENAGYAHAHPFVVLDAAEADVDVDAIGQETFRPVVAKHVAECEGAEWSAHDLDRAVSVRRGDEIDEFATYVAEYVAVAPDQDLLERSDKYLMFAAAQYASSSQKYSKSRLSADVVKADRCHQEYADTEARQSHDHGERIVRSDRPGIGYECHECGSAFDIDQDAATLVRARLDASESDRGSGVATDGGESGETAACDDDVVIGEWPSAEGHQAYAEPTFDPDDPDDLDPEDVDPIVIDIERPSLQPQWTPVAVVQRWSDEERLVGSPGGVEYAEVVREGGNSLLDTTPLEWLPRPPDADIQGPEPWERTEAFTESQVRTGEVPPPEVIDRELGERHHDKPITPKDWPDDWYARRFERDRADDGLDDDRGEDLSDVEERIERYRRQNPDASAAEVAGALSLPPEVVE